MILSASIAGYLRLRSHFQAPFQWSREANTYTNTYYGLQITKQEGWLRYTDDNISLEKRIFLSRLFGSGTPLLFAKRNLIEFHKLSDAGKSNAIITIGPVDDLKGKWYGRSVENYAHVSLEATLAPKKIWLKRSQIKLTELSGRPCAKLRTSYEIPKIGELENQFYFFIKDKKGFHIGYFAKPSEFDKYHDEAAQMIQSIRFSEQTVDGKHRGEYV